MADAGTYWYSTLPGATILGRTNYLASAGDPRPRTIGTTTFDVHGLMYYNSKEKLGAIPDGSSNTIMFAESAGGINFVSSDAVFNKPQWWNQAWAGAMWFSAFGMCPNSNFTNCTAHLNDGGKGLSVFAAGSLHAGGVCNVAMGDGSVRGINAPNISSPVLAFLTGGRDGQIVSPDF
jgi:prepilin-type processing-associated H-X9-DG protein